MSILDATVNDIPGIRKIAEQTWPDTFGSILSREQIRYMLDRMYCDSALITQMLEWHHHFLLYMDKGKLLGFISFEHNYRSLSGTKIHKFYLLPYAQNQGIGRRLLTEVTRRALEAGDDHLTLNVNRFNASIQKYERMGFRKTGEEDIDIGQGYLMEDAIMTMTIP